jgi:glycosyltransferase involved in cell wall biosynthesis
MKVIIISAAYPLRGGIAHFAGSLYRELSIENDVKVYTFKRQYPAFLFPGKSQIETGDASEKIPSSVILDSINPVNWIKVSNKIIKEKPDLIIFKHWMPFFAPCYGVIAKRLKKLKSVKLLAICHNIIPHEKRPGDRILSKYFLKKIDYFVLLSGKVQADLFRFIKNPKSEVLPHPIYSLFGEGVTKSLAKEKLGLGFVNYILFFGFIRDYKGLDVLIEALSFIKKSLNVKLIVAGEFYSDEKPYLNLIKKFNLQNSVILKKDFIPTSDVKYYFSASDAVILPYRSATQSGIVQIAVNFARPVIASDVGGISEVIKNGEAGYIVKKEDPKALADAITKFYDEKKESEFTINITKIREKYSWKNFAKGIFELIET